MEPEAYCFHQSFEPTGAFDFRTDRHYLLYARKGTLRLEAGGRRWTLPPARAALIAAGHPIRITIVSRVTSASILFSQNFAEPPPNPLSVFEISPLTRELINECAQWDQDSGPLSPYAATLFTALAAASWRQSESPSPCVLPTARSEALARAMALTEELCPGAPVFEDIAKRTGQSPRALARRFSTEIGMTWGEVLRRIRMIRAVEALAGGDAPITEIAFSVGYNSLSAFNAAFRDMTGRSPGTFRATLRG